MLLGYLHGSIPSTRCGVASRSKPFPSRPPLAPEVKVLPISFSCSEPLSPPHSLMLAPTMLCSPLVCCTTNTCPPHKWATEALMVLACLFVPLRRDRGILPHHPWEGLAVEKHQQESVVSHQTYLKYSWLASVGNGFCLTWLVQAAVSSFLGRAHEMAI